MEAISFDVGEISAIPLIIRFICGYAYVGMTIGMTVSHSYRRVTVTPPARL